MCTSKKEESVAAGAIKVQVDLSDGNQFRSKKSDLLVYFTVDKSASMSGAKMDQVISSISELFGKAPAYARFVIRCFAEEVSTVVSKRKKFIDIRRALLDLKKTGGETALYDAWSKTLTEIPFGAHKEARIYVLIFTDGGDNASHQSLEVAVEQTKKFLKKPDVFFTFIQAGKLSPSVQALRHCFANNYRCQILEVEDSAKGIKFGFDKVRQNMQALRFQVELTSNDPESLAKHLTGLKISTGGSKGSSGGQIGIQFNNDSREGQRNASYGNTLSAPSGHITTPIRSFNSSNKGGRNYSDIRGSPGTSNSASSPRPFYESLASRFGWAVDNLSYTAGGGTSSLLGMNKSGFVRVVAPRHVVPGDLAAFMSQFGACRIETVNIQPAFQTILLSFCNPRDAEGLLQKGFVTFQGKVLSVSLG